MNCWAASITSGATVLASSHHRAVAIAWAGVTVPETSTGKYDPPCPQLMNETLAERTRREVHEIADVLLRQQPPGTHIADVWNEVLSLHRVRYETQFIPPDESGAE
jgi:hypothetical protein